MKRRTPPPIWTRSQVDQILAVAEGSHKTALVLLAETGMRESELKWLTWEDVDFEDGLLHIRPKEGWQPKTGSQRAIRMSARVRQFLERLPRRVRWVITAAPSTRDPEGNQQISERRLREYLQLVLKRLGLSGQIHLFRQAVVSNA